MIIRWRNREDTRPGLRTPFMVNEPMQEDWYQRISDRRSPDRYWAAVSQHSTLVAVVGLTGIQWENGLAEVSLLTDPESRGQGLGREALAAVLAEGFDRMRLLTIIGECYWHNPARAFWSQMIAELRGEFVVLPRRKFWNGQLHDSLYFTFTVDAWRARS